MANENLRHDADYYNEEDNICNMNELGKIEIYQSEKTGKIYLDFIMHSKKFSNYGSWQITKEIFPEEFEKLENTLLDLKAERKKGDWYL